MITPCTENPKLLTAYVNVAATSVTFASVILCIRESHRYSSSQSNILLTLTNFKPSGRIFIVASMKGLHVAMLSHMAQEGRGLFHPGLTTLHRPAEEPELDKTPHSQTVLVSEGSARCLF